jgi:hypothetical protein
MPINVPKFPNVPNLEATLNQVSRAIENLRDRAISKEKANDSVLLQAPDKSVWIVKVTNAGALTVTKVSG